MELWLHCPDMPSWRGAQLKAQGLLLMGKKVELSLINNKEDNG
jgi:hypothetical protein